MAIKNLAPKLQRFPASYDPEIHFPFCPIHRDRLERERERVRAGKEKGLSDSNRERETHKTRVDNGG
jgi:hypothetical protein